MLREQLRLALFTGEDCSQAVPRPDGQAKPNSATQITQKLASHCSSSTSSRPPIATDRRAGLATGVQRQTAAVCLSCSQSAPLHPLPLSGSDSLPCRCGFSQAADSRERERERGRVSPRSNRNSLTVMRSLGN